MYEVLAQYYDAIHNELTEDIDFLRGHALEITAPILELGCGTGRLMLPLARAGSTVSGIDCSAAMLDQLARKVSKEDADVRSRLSWHQREIGDDHGQRQFGLAIASYNTLMHVPLASWSGALRSVQQALINDGRLIIDLANPFYLESMPNDRLLTLERRFKLDHLEVVQLSSSAVDTERQVLATTWMFDAMPEGGGTVSRQVVQMRFHYAFAHEIELLLPGAGLRLTAIYGDYDRSPFNEEAPRLIIEAVPAKR